ncbi:MAG: AAA family ATPase [Planctomycetaceae bacterium]
MARPFAPVVGQEAAVAALSSLLRRGGGEGATLLWGPKGVGRFLLAHRAACAILGDTPGSLARAEGFHHADLHVVEPGEGIEGVRAAREAMSRRAVEGPRPVLLLRDADRLHIEALNALLKTLEEPPAGAAVILVVESPDSLPATVASRCARVRARLLDRASMAEVLRRNGCEPDAAADAEGSPGRALYQKEAGVRESVASLLPLLQGRERDPLGEAEKLSRARGGEKPADLRRRFGEVLRVAAARLRRELPGSEATVRALLEGLGSLYANANPGIVMAHLVVQRWVRHGN